MKAIITFKWMVVLGVAFFTTQVCAGEQLVLKTQKERENYSTGVSIVRALKQQGGEVNLDIVIQGMKDEITGEKLLLTEKELQKATEAREAEMMMHKRKQAVFKGDEINSGAGKKTRTVDAEQSNGPLMQQQERQDQSIERADLSGQLAQKDVSPKITAPQTGNRAPNGISGGQQQANVEPQADQNGQIGPNGLILSKRNQAKMRVDALKAQMRAGAASGATIPDE